MATVNGKQMSMAPREEDLQELEDLLRDMHKRVDDAHSDGRVYMMGQYARMVALISPEISRIQLRFKREQELLGHSDISITLGLYSHLLPTMQQDMVDKWDDAFKLDNEEKDEDDKTEDEKDVQ